MGARTVYLVCGYLSIVTGIVASLSIYRRHLLFYGIILAIVGMVAGMVNIFLNERHQFEDGKFPKGYLGMFLSSLPVLFLFFLNYKFRK
jgi:hypothetical protein